MSHQSIESLRHTGLVFKSDRERVLVTYDRDDDTLSVYTISRRGNKEPVSTHDVERGGKMPHLKCRAATEDMWELLTGEESPFAEDRGVVWDEAMAAFYGMEELVEELVDRARCTTERRTKNEE